MLEWTGERYLPWVREPALAYEHLHRYAYASQFVRGRRVLDLATGEGYGANLLAQGASFVVGIDHDEHAIRHAARKYEKGNLHFLTGTISEIPIYGEARFDVIVCFEALEHISDHERLMDEVKRLLARDGLFIVSTPNKMEYTDQTTSSNPFHLKELYFDEFDGLLARHFKHRAYWGQRIYGGSSIWPIDPPRRGEFSEYVIARNGPEFGLVKREFRRPLYFIALAADSASPASRNGSILIDSSDEYITAWEDTVKSYEQQIEEHRKKIRNLREGLSWRESQVQDLEQTIRSHEAALAWRASQGENCEVEIHAYHRKLDQMATPLKEKERRAQQMSQERDGLVEELTAIKASLGWRLLNRYRNAREKLLPARTQRRAFYERLLAGRK